jgi:hypothetical protein
MNMHLALRLSAVGLAICVAAMIANIAAYSLHLTMPPTVARVSWILGFAWPLALVFFGTYLRKVRQAGAAQEANPPA